LLKKIWFARFAVVGRPNAGKSSFINALIGKERYIVTDIRYSWFYRYLTVLVWI
jgi:predicted GTPase